MGNENSMPQTGDEEFESQARAPPTAILPPNAQQPQQQQQQQQPPNTTSSSRGGRMMNAVFHRRQNNAANAASNEFRPQMGAPPMLLEDMVMMSPEQQQQYYEEQQELYMAEQQQQEYYNGGSQGSSLIYNGETSSFPTPATTTTQGVSTTPSRKGFRPTGRAGAALINSMKNLSLGSGVLGRGGNSQNSASSLKGQGTTKEWETRWDEDDDSDGEDEIAKPPAHQQAQQQQQPQIATTQVVPQGASSKLQHASSRQVAENGLLASPLPTNNMAPYSAETTPNDLKPPKAHLITATPDQPGSSSSAIEDGVEWDTGAVPLESANYEKPNVQMFLPLLRVLGKGSFGKVVLVQKRVGHEHGQLFAMKILRKSHLVRRRQIERTRTERKVLSVVNHPFIMKLHYAFQTPDKLYLVLDYCPGGELFFHLSRFRRFPERVARFYAAELLLALGHLHKRGIIYRDLKPENVLLDADGHVKLGDFGLAKAGIQHACEGATSMCGTPEYMAPEVLAQQGHGFCVDYWGLGMLVYEMMTGLPPWYTTDRTRLFRRLRSAPLEIPTYFSQGSASCVSALLERNPRRRLGVTGIRAAMEHEFFRSISWRALYGRRVEAPIRPCEGWTQPGTGSDDASPTPPQQMNGNDPDLDAATANFDNTFTRMPVETDDHPDVANQSDSEDLEELHEDTFIGFTFDDKDRDEIAAAAAAQQTATAQRLRTHHYNGNGDSSGQPNGPSPHPQQPGAGAPVLGPARHLD